MAGHANANDWYMTSFKYQSNRPVVIRKAQDAAEQIGKRIGAMVMTTARQSLGRPRKDGKPSAPGSPPRASGTFKRNIRFAWDASTRSVVVGPQLLSGKPEKDAIEALESGKSTTRTVLTGKGRDRRRRRVRANYEARPFMVPALEKRIGELPSLWTNAIRN